jgi:hypothetical protein
MIARGKRQGVPLLFVPAGPLSCRIGAVLAAALRRGTRYRARGPPSEAPIKIAMHARRRGTPQFRPRTCCWASGRTPPAQR